MQPTYTLPDSLLLDVLDLYWDQLAAMAYRGYEEQGRGVVALFPPGELDPRHERLLRATYIVFSDLSELDPAVQNVIERYGADTEFVLQYLREEGDVRTIRFRAEPPRKTPKEVWLSLQGVSEGGKARKQRKS